MGPGGGGGQPLQDPRKQIKCDIRQKICGLRPRSLIRSTLLDIATKNSPGIVVKLWRWPSQENSEAVAPDRATNVCRLTCIFWRVPLCPVSGHCYGTVACLDGSSTCTGYGQLCLEDGVTDNFKICRGGASACRMSYSAGCPNVRAGAQSPHCVPLPA